MRQGILFTFVAMASIALMLAGGCGDDGGPQLVISLEISPDAATVEICEAVSIGVTITGGESEAVDWYVNDVLGGNATVGTVSQTNPSVYTAPDSVPSPARVAVRAVSRQDNSKMDTCLVTVKFTRVYVNASTGDDDTGSGGLTNPLKSITRGLVVAQAGMTVLVAAGTYDEANGEEFPITLTDSISLVGEGWETTIISGYSETAFFYETITLAGDACALRKLKVVPEGVPAGTSIPIYIPDDFSNIHVDSVKVDEAKSHVLRVEDAVNTVIENCYFASSWDEPYSTCISLLDDRGTIVKDCSVIGFDVGIFLNGLSDALIQGCTVEDNNYGVRLWHYGHPNHNPNPDLGGGTRGGTGGNVIRNSVVCGLTNLTENTIYAKYNTWTNDPPVDGEDICNEGTGEVLWE